MKKVHFYGPQCRHDVHLSIGDHTTHRDMFAAAVLAALVHGSTRRGADEMIKEDPNELI